MTEEKALRLSKVAKEFNVGLQHVVEYLETKGVKVDGNPNAKISMELYAILQEKYQPDKMARLDAQEVTKEKLKRDNIVIEAKPGKSDAQAAEAETETDENLKESLEKIKFTAAAEKTKSKAKTKKEEPVAETPVVEEIIEPVVEPIAKSEGPEIIKAKFDKQSPKVLGKIDLEDPRKKAKAKKDAEKEAEIKLAAEEEEKKKAAKAKKKEEPVVETPVVETPAPPVAETPVAIIPPPPPAVEPPAETPAPETKEGPVTPEHISVKFEKLTGPNILGKINLPTEQPKKKPVASSSDFEKDGEKRKRKRKDHKPGTPQGGGTPGTPGAQGERRDFSNRPGNGQRSGPGQQRSGGPGGQRSGPGQQRSGGPGQRSGPGAPRVEPTEKEIQDQIKATLARLSGSGKSRASKFRKEKRTAHAQRAEQIAEQSTEKVIQVTEFVSANELAKLMDISVTQIISTCMSLGMFVSINQRLDAETLTVVAEEFGYKVEFVSADVSEAINEDTDTEDELLPRAPIVTVMGHVDHGKTSLLDYIRKANVIAGEAGGITQHIGAYEVKLEDGRRITFLDTPGHEAFTAMRARGAKVTDVAIIVVAADDSVMPQTKEAINHAMAAGVPIVFAINKVDKADSNPERIKEQLAGMNFLVESWGGKYQSQDISAKKGMNIDKLLDKVLLEAEMLDLKANPERNAKGTVIESSLDKGRGYVTTVLVQTGTLKIGDVILAGCYSGRVKAMFNERGGKISEAGPSAPAMILGMTGAPQAGDQFNVMDDEREARDIANKRLQLQREQGIRTHKHITLDEIGRRLAIGNFKELNVIVKGDVDGSIEALADSLLKLSNPEIQVNVIHKSVGQISESDVMLASASNAIIIGFQVRPSVSARKLAESEQIDIRLYSIIYDAINELKAAMEGMLAPEFEEKILGNIEVREVFKIPKIGTIAGCMVLDGKVTRNTKVRVIRDGIVAFSGDLASLKRFKDDVKEVTSGFECGLSLNGFNDIRVGDIIEGYEQVAVKRTLA
ncbi:MAG: translation initiation factor IF-2 [Bacteroidota bacterium]